MNEAVRIVIVDDHPFVRETLRNSLELQPDMLVVAAVENGTSAIEVAAAQQPDIVLMDYNMPGIDGAEATRQIVASHPSIAVIGVSLHENGPVEQEMLQAGAAHYVSKERGLPTLLSTIREYIGSAPH